MTSGLIQFALVSAIFLTIGICAALVFTGTWVRSTRLRLRRFRLKARVRGEKWGSAHWTRTRQFSALPGKGTSWAAGSVVPPTGRKPGGPVQFQNKRSSIAHRSDPMGDFRDRRVNVAGVGTFPFFYRSIYRQGDLDADRWRTAVPGRMRGAIPRI